MPHAYFVPNAVTTAAGKGWDDLGVAVGDEKCGAALEVNRNR